MGAYLTPPTEPQSVRNRNETGGPGESAHPEDSSTQMRASSPDERSRSTALCALVFLVLLGITAFIAAAFGVYVIDTMLRPNKPATGGFWSASSHDCAMLLCLLVQAPATLLGIVFALSGLWLGHFRVQFVFGLAILVVCSVVTLLSLVFA